MTRYQPSLLFSVEAFHSYFTNGLCTVFSFQPGANTLTLQQRYAFPLSETKNGFIFYQAGDTSAAAYLQYVSNTTGINSFDFTLKTITQNFYNYTDLPPVWKGNLEYDSSNVIPAGENTFQLNQQLSPEQNTAVAGTLRIQFSDLIRLLENGITPVYTIKFTARQTQWQYYFINDSGIAFGDPAITSDEGIVFDGPQAVTIPDGKQAQLFTSGQQLLSLCERPTYRFSLVNRTRQQSGRAKTIIKRLPCADPESFTLTDAENQLQITSPIYVFI